MAMLPCNDNSEARYEEQHVHQVYNSIASHFSSTRFKPWPVVDEFLRGIRPGSVGLDVGCGNGKYLSVRQDVYIVASDRSAELLKFASHHQPHDVAIADTLSLPHPNGTFDFAISIAVIHHLSSRERRREAVRCILETLRPGTGQALIFVWALEQKGSRRGWDVGDEQDVLVPWVLKAESTGKKEMRKSVSNGKDAQMADNTDSIVSSDQEPQDKKQTEDTTYQRYYHLYRKGELDEDIETVGGVIVRNGYDRDNWWAIFARKSGT